MKIPEPRKLKSGSYFIQLRLNGKSYSITEATPGACKTQAKLVKASVQAGKKIATNSRSDPTLRTIMQTYIDSREKVLSPSTIRGYQTILNNRFQNYIDKRPGDIKWQALVNDELRDGTSTKTIKNSWAFLAASLRYSEIEVPTVKLPQIFSDSREWLDHEQIERFVKAVHDTPVEIPALLALHSLRRSEIVGLEWEKINLVDDTIAVEGSAVFGADQKLVRKSTNKNNSSRRTVPIMIPELKAALESVPIEKRSGPVVRCNPNTIWAQVNRVCKANDLPEVGVHGLRHSFASLAYHLGMSELETMELGGWSDTGTMRKIYTHLAESDRLKAQNKMKLFYAKNQSKN